MYQSLWFNTKYPDVARSGMHDLPYLSGMTGMVHLVSGYLNT